MTLFTEIQSISAAQQKAAQQVAADTLQTSAQESTSPATQTSAQPRTSSRKKPRKPATKEKLHRASHTKTPPPAINGASSAVQPPSRRDIQMTTFEVRDDYKVKVQTQVPPEWHEELHDIANDLRVGKTELYRFILGEFLGKVGRSDALADAAKKPE